MAKNGRKKNVEKIAAPKRVVWSRDKAEESIEKGIPKQWEPFSSIDGKESEVCFWGLTYDEGLIARRLGSKPKLVKTGNDYQAELEPDPDKLPLVYIMMSARAGDGPEYAYNPQTQRADTIFDARVPADWELVKKLLPGGRIQVLFELVDILSTVSLSRMIGNYRFFGHVIALQSGFQNSLLPSLEDPQSNFSKEDVLDRIRLMGEDLKDLKDLAETLLLGYTSPESK